MGTEDQVQQRVSAAVVGSLLVVLSAAPAGAHLGPEEPASHGPAPGWVAPALSVGDTGPWVRALQAELAAAGFRPGPLDGRFGHSVLQAVYAFQKVHGLPRDGTFRPAHWDILDEPIELPPGLSGDRVEVDLARQVLYLVEEESVVAVLPVASGNGGLYRSYTGRLARAVTPEGSFRFYRHYSGWRISYLGGLYEPFYFLGGYAIHGSTSVPPQPASHGCVRVTMADMDWLKHRLQIGMPIYVYGVRTPRPTLEVEASAAVAAGERA